MNSNRSSKFGGRKSFGEKKDFGGNRDFGMNSAGRAMMHQATCSECRSACEVPFKPTGSKPVLCRNCFKGTGNTGARRPDSGRSSERNNFYDKRPAKPENSIENYKREFEQLDRKLDSILELLVTVISKQSRQDKPVPVEVVKVEAVAKKEAPKKSVDDEVIKVPAKKVAVKKAAPKKVVAKKVVVKKAAPKKKK
jgi:CxxC-x17-CxxC domain-containing protein